MITDMCKYYFENKHLLLSSNLSASADQHWPLTQQSEFISHSDDRNKFPDFQQYKYQEITITIF